MSTHCINSSLTLRSFMKKFPHFQILRVFDFDKKALMIYRIFPFGKSIILKMLPTYLYNLTCLVLCGPLAMWKIRTSLNYFNLSNLFFAPWTNVKCDPISSENGPLKNASQHHLHCKTSCKAQPCFLLTPLHLAPKKYKKGQSWSQPQGLQ